MKEIYCPVNLFSAKLKVYKIDTEDTMIAKELGEADTIELPRVLLECCKTEEIYKIHLVGEDKYTHMLAQDVEIYKNIKYKENKEIEIEVN